MLLSDKRILEERERGNIIIEPFDIRHLGTNSYDCRIGEWYFKGDNDIKEIDLSNDESVREYWGHPKRAVSGKIAIEPGTTILAHTLEVIGGRNGYLVSMHSRSTTVRTGLSVCRCGGQGDVGYISRWCMEVSNHTQATISIPIGYRICQFSVEYVGEMIEHYHEKQYSGNYGRDWTPFDLLPQSLKAWDRVEMERIQASLAQESVR